jgi:hypothetical protein
VRRPSALGVLLTLSLGACAHRTPSELRAQAVLEQARSTDVDLQIDCAPSDAEVAVDEVPRGLCSDYAAPGAGLRLGAGMHRVSVRKTGYLPYVTYYEPSGARLSLSVQLKPAQGEGKKP